MTNEEKTLLKKMNEGGLDGFVGNELITTGGTSICKVIKNGVPIMFKEGPGQRIFNNKENYHKEGVRHILREWTSDNQKLEFLRKYGWLMADGDVKVYSAKFKSNRGNAS